MKQIVEENTKLAKENQSLRQNIADLNSKVNCLTWKSFRRSHKSNHVVVGNNIIRDISVDKLEDTEVICKKEGCISDIKTVVEDLTPGYETISLVVGGKDCVTNPEKPADDIVKSYCEMIDSAKNKCQNVKVTSMCPVLVQDNVQEKVDAVNAGLLACCNDKENVEFVDVSPVFQLADGSINDGYMLPDGINVTKAGMNKIASKLGLHLKDKSKGIGRPWQQKKQQTTQPGLHRRDSQVKNNVRSSSGGRKTMDARDSYCFNCGEPNHVKDHCRHSGSLECHQCRRTGHKAKFCDLYKK